MLKNNTILIEWDAVDNEITSRVLSEIEEYSSSEEKGILQNDLELRIREESRIELPRWAVEILIERYNRALNLLIAEQKGRDSANRVQQEQDEENKKEIKELKKKLQDIQGSYDWITNRAQVDRQHRLRLEEQLDADELRGDQLLEQISKLEIKGIRRRSGKVKEV